MSAPDTAPDDYIFVPGRGYDESATEDGGPDPFGARFVVPGLRKALAVTSPTFQPVLTPIFPSYRRDWTEPDSAPDWAESGLTEDPLTNLEWPNHSLSLRQEEVGFVQSWQQRRWRLAWSLGADPEALRGWGFMHLRWRVAEWIGINDDIDAPDVIMDDNQSVTWQKGIDPVPPAYDPGDSLTWPGTPWTEAPLPTIPSTILAPVPLTAVRLRFFWPYNAQLGSYQGRIPGGRLPGSEFARPWVPSGTGFIKGPL